MTSKTHTPGPWHATEPHDEMVRVTAPGVVSGGSHTVVALHAYHLSLTDEERANASLIAAAPELLDAAALGLAYMLAVKESYMAEDIAKVRAAIAKARGES